MEKILVQKELYKWRYEFLNFIEFSGFYFDFSATFQIYFLIKKSQKGFINSRETREADEERRAHVAEPHKATWAHGRIRGRVHSDGLAFDGPRGIVGPG